MGLINKRSKSLQYESKKQIQNSILNRNLKLPYSNQIYSQSMKRVSISDSQNPQNQMKISRNFSISTSRKQENLIPLEELKSILSQYRQLKQLPLNTVSQTKQTLWSESPCTVRCISRNVSVDRTQKFKIGSIYHRDNINQQKKIFTESQKPELMLKNFRRQIEQASYSKRKYGRKQSKISQQKPKTNDKMRRTMPFFQNKFYQIPLKTELKYDRNGCRSVYSGDYNVKTIIQRLRSTKSNFTSSQRIDLGLPLNFNPGPGNYFAESISEFGCQTYRSRKNKTLFNFHKNTQRLHSRDNFNQNA